MPVEATYASPLNLAIQNREHYSEFLELCFCCNLHILLDLGICCNLASEILLQVMANNLIL